MSLVEPWLHLHNNDTGPKTPEEVELALKIAVTHLEAFGFTCSEKTSKMAAETHRGIIIEPDSKFPETIWFPNGNWESSTVWENCQNRENEYAILYWAALVETAIAWREAGLIDRFCDLGRWGRRIGDRDEKKWPDACGRIRQGMAALGLPIYGPGEYQPEIMAEHRPRIKASKLAQEIHRRMDNPGTAVILFGSRGRGTHLPKSDTDILVWMDVSVSDELEKQAAQTAKETEAVQLGGLDICFVDQWNKNTWNDHRERLMPASPDRLVFASPEMLKKLPISLAGQENPHGGKPFYFLTEGCMTHNWHVEDEGVFINFGRYDRLDMPRCKP